MEGRWEGKRERERDVKDYQKRMDENDVYSAGLTNRQSRKNVVREKRSANAFQKERVSGKRRKQVMNWRKKRDI